MNIFIKDTNKQTNLSIIDPHNGSDYIQDFIGNTGALSDGQFTWDDEQSAFVCDQLTFDWWEKVVNDNQKIEDRIRALVDKHGSESVHAIVHSVGNCDLEDYANLVNTELDNAFPV